MEKVVRWRVLTAWKRGKSTGAQSLTSHAQTRGQALRRFGNRTALASLARRVGGYLKGGGSREGGYGSRAIRMENKRLGSRGAEVERGGRWKGGFQREAGWDRWGNGWLVAVTVAGMAPGLNWGGNKKFLGFPSRWGRARAGWVLGAYSWGEHQSGPAGASSAGDSDGPA